MKKYTTEDKMTRDASRRRYGLLRASICGVLVKDWLNQGLI